MKIFVWMSACTAAFAQAATVSCEVWPLKICISDEASGKICSAEVRNDHTQFLCKERAPFYSQVVLKTEELKEGFDPYEVGVKLESAVVKVVGKDAYTCTALAAERKIAERTTFNFYSLQEVKDLCKSHRSKPAWANSSSRHIRILECEDRNAGPLVERSCLIQEGTKQTRSKPILLSRPEAARQDALREYYEVLMNRYPHAFGAKFYPKSSLDEGLQALDRVVENAASGVSAKAFSEEAVCWKGALETKALSRFLEERPQCRELSGANSTGSAQGSSSAY